MTVAVVGKFLTDVELGLRFEGFARHRGGWADVRQISREKALIYTYGMERQRQREDGCRTRLLLFYITVTMPVTFVWNDGHL
jgi:hypothetical protein